MCPACIANTAAIVAGAGSSGGILALCIGRVAKYFSITRWVRRALIQEIRP
jgi:hypothetical protein